MKKTTVVFIFILIILIAAPIVYYGLNRVRKYENFSKDKNIRVFLVYGSSLTPYGTSVLSAYKSVLKEEGVPFKVISYSDLISFNPHSLSKNIPAVIFPDAADEELPSSMEFWAENYLKNGGSVAVVLNAGIKSKEGFYLKKGVFSKIIGLNYEPDSKTRNKSYVKVVEALLRFRNKSSMDFFQIQEGDTMHRFLSGYKYGPLSFPMTETAGLKLSDKNIYAYGVKKNGKEFPAVVLTPYGRGQILYADLPLGYLKGYASSGILIKDILRTFLFKIVRMPHLVYAPYGKGGLVVNWHIENYLVSKSIPYMLKNRLLRKNLKFSFDISAGSFEDRPGDERGVDACGKNRVYIKMLLPYGTIGTDGGWTHNWWYRKVLSGKLDERQMYDLIKKNNKCLQSITGYKITEYMPSEGVFPQPVSTKILRKLGMIATYYTGSIGSGPTRVFWNGKMISRKVIAFPVSIDGDVASPRGLRKANKSNAEVLSWQKSIVNYCIKNRVIRLWYSHPYDIRIYHYLKAMKFFTDYIEKKQNQGKLLVRPMAYFAKFMLRFLKTKYSFVSSKNGSIALFIKNKEGLKGITVALPKNQIRKPAISGVYTIDEGKNYYYIAFTGGLNEDIIHFRGIHGANGS
ncbi:MAG: polysaccharide deacetylase family protein [bacterium]